LQKGARIFAEGPRERAGGLVGVHSLTLPRPPRNPERGWYPPSVAWGHA